MKANARKKNSDIPSSQDIEFVDLIINFDGRGEKSKSFRMLTYFADAYPPKPILLIKPEKGAVPSLDGDGGSL